MNRRKFLTGSTASFVGLSVRSLLTGLPPAFFLTGQLRAQDAGRKFAVIAQSGAGESVNGAGPGSFDSPDFIHPSDSATDLTRVIDGRTFSAADLGATTDYLGGANPVRISRCFEALGPMQDNMAFFHHRTGFGIHPQFQLAQKIDGRLKGDDGRGQEELPAAIAQENATALGTLTDRPIVLSGNATFQDAPLGSYSPTSIRELVLSAVSSEVPAEMFSATRNYLIDEVYQGTRESGDPNQQRFLDEYVVSQNQATEVAERLLDEVNAIDDDGMASQMKMAAIIIKLRLAPVVVVDYRLSGDNHVGNGMTVEAEHTLNMMADYREFYDFAVSNGVWNDLLYATVSVFGRSMNETGNGRGHNGSLSTGLLFGGHLTRKVVGGIDATRPRGFCMPINANDGGTANPNVSEDDTFACYAKSVLQAAGVPSPRLDVRVPDVPSVALV
ncbi:MAG: hypothetical protein AAFR91_09850 [Pseudomonadota bacterium]